MRESSQSPLNWVFSLDLVTLLQGKMALWLESDIRLISFKVLRTFTMPSGMALVLTRSSKIRNIVMMPCTMSKNKILC